VVTTESHPYAVEILNQNFTVLKTVKSTTESGALSEAERLNYLLGRETKQGDLVAVIVTKKWNGDTWETMTETEW
jgi:hypothetical protein